MSVETPVLGTLYRLDIEPACHGEITAHGIRPYLQGQLVRIVWRESHPEHVQQHAYKCEVLSGPVAGTHQFIAASELVERDIEAELAKGTI